MDNYDALPQHLAVGGTDKCTNFPKATILRVLQ